MMISIVLDGVVVGSWKRPAAGCDGTLDGDAGLVAAVKGGDMTAFDVLMRRHREKVYGVLCHILGNREDAADLAQDAFLIAFRSIGKFRGQSKFYTWLYRIAVNLAMRYLRRRRLRRFFNFDNLELDPASEDFVATLAREFPGDRALLLKELQRNIAEALQGLSPKHRAVVVLSEIEGFSAEEIASMTKSSPGTVRSRLHYAKEYLKSALRCYL
ncbi:MAG: sigma-70 family RNA polymerase sigma factor [Puniceicoccales bacterium]|nr:sigma-70 family RNA polymerase sigma factor [Puniceicoccales bacterium]